MFNNNCDYALRLKSGRECATIQITDVRQKYIIPDINVSATMNNSIWRTIRLNCTKQTTGRLRALTLPVHGGDLWWCYGEWWWRYGCLRWLIGRWSRAIRKMRSWRWSLNVGAEHDKQLVDAEISVWILPKKVKNSMTITVYVVILITDTNLQVEVNFVTLIMDCSLFTINCLHL